MIDWVSIVRQSNRRFSNCMYFVPRSRRHRHKRERVLAHPVPTAAAAIVSSEDDPTDRSEHKCSTGCFKVRLIDNQTQETTSQSLCFYFTLFSSPPVSIEMARKSRGVARRRDVLLFFPSKKSKIKCGDKKTGLFK